MTLMVPSGILCRISPCSCCGSLALIVRFAYPQPCWLRLTSSYLHTLDSSVSISRPLRTGHQTYAWNHLSWDESWTTPRSMSFIPQLIVTFSQLLFFAFWSSTLLNLYFHHFNTNPSLTPSSWVEA